MNWIRGVVLVAALGVTSASVHADEVVLKDGTRIIGTIVSMGGGMLKIANSAAGEGGISIKFSEVQSFSTDGEHTFVLSDGSQLVGRPQVEGDGRVVVTSASAGPVSVELSQVTAVNPPAKKDVTHKGNVTLSGRITDGNSRTKSATGVANYEMRSKLSRLALYGDWNYGEDQGVLSARNATGRIKYDYFFSKRGFAYVNAVFTGDDFADLNLRTALGGGLGYQFIDGELDGSPYSWFEEAGISFFDEDFDVARDDRYTSARVSGNVDWEIKKGLDFFHFHEVFFGFESQQDIFADTRTGVRATLIENFFASFQVNYSWDNTPAANQRRGDTEYLWGLGYSFSK